MAEIEVGFKIKQNQIEGEQILLNQGFEVKFKTKTKDMYLGTNVNFEGKDEETVKQSLIRFRNFDKIENLKVLDESLPDRISVDKRTRKSYLKKLKNAGFKVIFKTRKEDWVYVKDGVWHQLQNIKDIGLLDYVYMNNLSDNLSEQELFEIAKQHILNLGFELEFELGVDKLRSLYYKKYMFSTNQIGLYKYQEKDKSNEV